MAPDVYVSVPDAKQIDRETGDLEQSVLDKLAKDGGKPSYRTFLTTYNYTVKEDMTRLVSLEVATAIDVVQAIITALLEGVEGGSDVARMSFLQGVLLFGAAAAGTGVAFGFGTAAILRLPVTGWGLVLVALGILAEFVLVALQDTPTEEWAAPLTEAPTALAP